MKKAKWNFDITLKILIDKLQNKMRAFKIGYYFTRHMKMIAPTLQERHVMKLRNTNNLLWFFMEHKAQKQSRVSLNQFLNDDYDQNMVIDKFRGF